jgi:hypothetical protein
LPLTKANSQKYSKYLPVTSKNFKTSHRKLSASESRAVREAEKAALRSAIESGKRRSTMNSRAAYDEDEMLRKVLEESKQEGTIDPSENGTSRKGKRAREDSDEYVFPYHPCLTLC